MSTDRSRPRGVRCYSEFDPIEDTESARCVADQSQGGFVTASSIR